MWAQLWSYWALGSYGTTVFFFDGMTLHRVWFT
jgi:hypothetical protein